MNDYDLINGLLEELKNRNQFYTILIFLVLNLVAIIAVFFLQFYLKRQERKQYRLQIREDRRLKIYEQINTHLDELSFFDGRIDSNLFLQKITETTLYISQNRVYLSKKMQSLLSNYLDYYKAVLADFRKRNIATESSHFDAFATEYNR